MAWPEIIAVEDNFDPYRTEIRQNQQNNCMLTNFAYLVLEIINRTLRCSLAELRTGKLKILRSNALSCRRHYCSSVIYRIMA